ncbi:hypothetical protein AHF37_03563 [Paragonimus kellicotti]|nr:hypothetical protein AHF37_03563 [Paragonimus kellicotti]
MDVYHVLGYCVNADTLIEVSTSLLLHLIRSRVLLSSYFGHGSCKYTNTLTNNKSCFGDGMTQQLSQSHIDPSTVSRRYHLGS